jgi:hypothetical protein
MNECGWLVWIGLPKFGPEPRFEPRTAGPDLQVRAQVLLALESADIGISGQVLHLIMPALPLDNIRRLV